MWKYSGSAEYSGSGSDDFEFKEVGVMKVGVNFFNLGRANMMDYGKHYVQL